MVFPGADVIKLAAPDAQSLYCNLDGQVLGLVLRGELTWKSFFHPEMLLLFYQVP